MANAWDKRETESGKAYAAFCVYRDLPPAERSIEKVHQKFSKSTRLLARWSSAHDWVARAEALDAHLQEIAQAAKAAEIERAISTGYAQMHERVQKLNAVAERIEQWLEDNDYQSDVYEFNPKTGETFHLKAIDVGAVNQLRAVFDDMAKELGHRVKKSEITGKDGKPVEIVVTHVRSQPNNS